VLGVLAGRLRRCALALGAARPLVPVERAHEVKRAGMELLELAGDLLKR
jgi:hypothetical protein